MLKWFSGKQENAEKPHDIILRQKDRQGDFLLRRYRHSDRGSVLNIAADSFSGVSLDENIEKTFGIIGKPWAEHKKDAVDYDLQQNRSLVLIAEVEKKIVGFVCNRIYPSRALGHITNIAVKKEFRGRNIGKALLTESLELLGQEGAKYVRIETLEQNETGKHVYPALGFEEVGRQVFYLRRI